MNQQRLEAALETLLGADCQPQSRFNLHLFETVPSTNHTLWELMGFGAPPGTVVIAGQQTAGRGQWGRQWQSSLGGLYLSCAIAPNIPATDQGQLTLCSAWGIATALRTRNIPVEIKWPNDLVLTGYKLGGILTETKVYQGHIVRAVIGVGVNWTNPVPDTGINLQTFLAPYGDHAPVQSLELLAALVLYGLNLGMQHLNPSGIEQVVKAYSEFLRGIGGRISVNGKSGILMGVTRTGELRVQLESDANPDAISEICLQPGTISLGYG